MAVSEKTIGRLSIYRRMLDQLETEGVTNVYSHQLANLRGSSAAQVRQDLKVVGFAGSPNHGYDVAGLSDSIQTYLETPGGTKVVLVGIGNLGRALLAYFMGRRQHLSIIAAFDSDPRKSGRVIHGCRCFAMEEMESTIADQKIGVAIIAVPGTDAQTVAAQLVELGIGGILNFAPVPLRVPGDVFVEDIDLTMALEKVSFFARAENKRE